MAERNESVFRLLLRSAERLSDRAILRGLVRVNTPRSKSRALLVLVTRWDQRRTLFRGINLPWCSTQWVIQTAALQSAMTLEKLHGLLVLFSALSSFECSQIPPFSSFRISLSRIETIFTGPELPNHRTPLLPRKRRLLSHKVELPAGWLFLL
jgi:hypothetical protein